MRYLLLLLLPLHLLYATMHPIDILPETEANPAGQIAILDQKELSFSKIDGIAFSEISDLAYDRKNALLHMVSDEGRLFTFQARLTDKIKTLTPLRGTLLKKRGGKPFKAWRHDSEGLTLDGRGHLLISFEEKPKIGWFHKNSAKYGQMIRKYRLPKILRKIKNYRSKNKGLESVTWHKRYGILTAAEWPVKQDSMKLQTIYSLSGKAWHFKAEPEINSAVTAIEVMDDGNLLVLERSYADLLSPLVVTLKKVFIHTSSHGLCRSKVLLKMNTHRGWNIDNFEGLTRVGKNRYLMVSDDNHMFFQKTLLIYFEIRP